jgi:hypothetical protein
MNEYQLTIKASMHHLPRNSATPPPVLGLHGFRRFLEGGGDVAIRSEGDPELRASAPYPAEYHVRSLSSNVLRPLKSSMVQKGRQLHLTNETQIGPGVFGILNTYCQPRPH